MRFWAFGKRNLKEIYRDPLALGFLLGMPIAFIVIFSFAFGGEHASPLNISVVNEDNRSATSEAFVQCLENMENLEVNRISEKSQAEEELSTGKLSTYLVIPEGFAQQAKQEGQPVKLELVFDEADPMTAQRVEPVIRVAAAKFLQISSPLDIKLLGQGVEVKDNYINYMVPGMIVFGLMILVPTGVRIIVTDKEKGFLSRLLTTPARPWDFILGYALALVPVVAVSTMIYLGVGMGMGLSMVGNLGLAFLVFFIIGLCCIGIAMILGALFSSEAQGEPACWFFLLPMAMISGAWWPTEQMPSVLQRIAAAFPFFHAMDASRQVITGGASFTTILPDLYWLIGWTVVLFAIGIILFRRQMAS